METPLEHEDGLKEAWEITLSNALRKQYTING
jgi:hypothetical protein